ncbi:zinc-binding protein A33-like [Xyrauchen texanus]|uniref:zinc-binding protein A33-like n=1 Tax=Xyrauchen texanus TaxID=154827 RepID=UPI002241F4DA|nr:zinc-binding protein A33-like [Xyrauchen texanus]
MASLTSNQEEDMCCPVCCDFFTDPVLLDCSHSFCRTCIDKSWSSQFRKTCPVCRRECFNENPLSNLVLRNIVDSFRDRKKSSVECSVERQESQVSRKESTEGAEERENFCSLHGKKLFFFCMDDQEALCTVCQRYTRHKEHHIIPVEEATQELKGKVRLSLEPHREELNILRTKTDECFRITQHIKEQTRSTKSLIKKDFEQLHHFLRLEEAARISSLEDEAEVKRNIMKKNLGELRKKVESLSNTIQTREKFLEREDLHFLQAYKIYNDSAPCDFQEIICNLPDALVDVAKHLGNLKFNVWEKMLGQVQYSPVIVDPNTAAPWLKLSEDLTRVHYGGLQTEIPDNPERFDLCVCVLGHETIGAGTHWWDVQVVGKTKWDMGVMMESVSRKGILNVNSECGFWALALRDGGQYSACTKPWTTLQLKRKPHRIRVCLNNDEKELSFYDPLDMTHIYTFTHLPSEKLIPFFSPCVSDQGVNKEPLRIIPIKVAVKITPEQAD